MNHVCDSDTCLAEGLLLDCKGVMALLGVTRASAETVMRSLDAVVFPGLRKTYVRRQDVLALVEASTYSKDQVAA
jgi:hypothetical protein